ncbi:MinD/ParA family protein [Actinoplanes sp. NPDC049265]|uniref:MinD/ParA family ATP-binding protein n=1 Tax=Actinoplanes sp. NPDC049265 TaxID=3363902 RepID=UPI0037178216
MPSQVVPPQSGPPPPVPPQPGSPSAPPSGSPPASPSAPRSGSASAPPSGSPSGPPSGSSSASPSGSSSASPSGPPSASPSGPPSASPSGPPSASPSGPPSASPSGSPSASTPWASLGSTEDDPSSPPDPDEKPAPDSPWAQPPQQRRASPAPSSGPVSAGPTAPPPPAPHPEERARATASVPPPRPQAEDGTGPVYRPPGPQPQPPHQPGQPPHGAPPHQPGPPQHQPGPAQQQHPGAPQQQQPGPPQHYAGPPQQHQPGPPPQAQQQRPGPYPPQVDPHAAHQAPPEDPYQQVPWGTDGTPTAEEFARRRLAKPAEPSATMGARAILQKGTMGLVRLAPGKYEREYKQDVEMVRRNFGGLRQVTVVNPKGGAGKTVAVLLLAMTFGQKRGGYVLAWDNNETQGTLGMRAQQDFHARTVRDMMRDLHLFRGSHGRVGDLSQYVRAQGEGMFDVLASDESATAGEMLTASAFAEIREIVSRFYKLIFVDTGNNVRAQNWQASMDATDQLVITMSARNDSAETAARMLDHLEQTGRQRLVRQAVSVVTMPTTRKDIDLPAIQRHFAARTRAVLLAPYEKVIDSGEPIRYGALSNGTKDAWLKIAAAVAEGL